MLGKLRFWEFFMSRDEVILLIPLMILAAMPVIIMLVIAFRRSHGWTYALSAVGIIISLAALSGVLRYNIPGRVTSLLVMDSYAFYYLALILMSGLAVAILSYDYLKPRSRNPEEYYVLLLVALLGSAVLAASNHFASFFLGLEILSVSLYALIAYTRSNTRSIEAGIKYLILAGASSSFLLFGMALVYARSGSLQFSALAALYSASGIHDFMLLTGTALIIVGIGFKLALVPFHLWTPDVYEGAPAPVTAFIATVSKGAMFALLLRYFAPVNMEVYQPLLVLFSAIAIASMFVGNLLALFQKNIKRILAYSSITHLGYLLIAFLASGPLRVSAVSFYLAAYFVTTLGAFGIVTILSPADREADSIEDYTGLYRRSPWLATAFTLMLLSLAGIPLTAGFIGKFYVLAAGAGSGLWLLVIMLVINSAIGLYYYLRVIVAMYGSPSEVVAARRFPVSVQAHIVLAALVVLLIWFGVYPGSLIRIIQAAAVWM